MIEYRYLQPENARAAAEIHIDGQPGTILTRLGRSFLARLYYAMCVSEWADAFGVFDDGRLVGMAATAVSSDHFFSEFKRKHLWRVAIPSAFAALKDPKIVAGIIEGWKYTDHAENPERECDVLFLGVIKAYRRHGLAPELVRHMFGWANEIGLESSTFMVDKRNRPMRWMVSQLNELTVAREFEAYGRTMVLYRVPIAANQTDAKMPLGQPHTRAHNYLKIGEAS